MGDTGHGWASTIREIKPPHVKLVCPTAASMPVKLNMGLTMPSWFDLFSLSMDGPEDGEGIKRSSAYISSLIEEEKTKHNIPENRILIGGFSQGGALSLHTVLRHPKPLAGVIGLSCWLPLRSDYPGAFHECNKDVPALQCHGDEDPLVPTAWGAKTADILKPLLTKYTFKTYPGLSHSSCDEVSQMNDRENSGIIRLTVLKFTLQPFFIIPGTQRCCFIYRRGLALRKSCFARFTDCRRKSGCSLVSEVVVLFDFCFSNSTYHLSDIPKVGTGIETVLPCFL